MHNLIKIEFMKLKRRNKLLGIFITFILSSASLIPIMFYDNKVPSWTDITGLTISLANLISNIFLCVLVGDMFLDEYNNKTINVMFNYPISRTKIYFSKIFVLLLYSILLTIIGSVFYIGIVFTMNTFHPVLTGTFNHNLMLTLLPIIVTCSITNTMFAVVYSFFATVIRSIPLMIFSCILLVNFASNISITDSYLVILKLLGISIICSLAAIPIIYSLNKKDVIC